MAREFSYDEEIICNYKVSAKMKQIWKIELDLLEKFINVCEKYNLKYYLNGGTLLGAVRHKGFIPWDDDIDVAMFREDYNKLLEIAPKEFDDNIFFQTSYNDKLYRGHAQIRNSNTTAILKGEEDKKYNQGIFIDIFPYDIVPSNNLFRTLQKLKCYIYRNMLQAYYINFKGKKMSKYLFKMFIFKIVSKILCAFGRL